MFISLQADGCGIADTASDEAGPSWDLDNDDYSNAVEADPANIRLYNFNTGVRDPSYSIAHGSPSNGYLSDGIHLPQTNNNYYTYSSDPATRQWGDRWLINDIEDVARRWDIDYGQSESCLYYAKWAPLKFGVGDMSYGNESLRQFGGLMDPHVQHQNGLEVDVRFLRTDGASQRENLEIHTDSIYYDAAATADLLSCFIRDPNVYRILIDTAYAGITTDQYGVIHHDPTHRDHFHVWRNDPDGEGN